MNPEKFWNRATVGGPDECWPWNGALTRGYGSICIGGRTRRAQVVAWELHHGTSFPEGMFGCHSCDNPACVNPRHIWPGTHTDNMRDAQRKGRLRSGVRIPKTHCKRGHAYTPENTIIKGRGRACRTCHNACNREWRARQEASRAKS